MTFVYIEEKEAVVPTSIAVWYVKDDNMRGTTRYGLGGCFSFSDQMIKARALFNKLRKDPSISNVRLIVSMSDGDDDITDEYNRVDMFAANPKRK